MEDPHGKRSLADDPNFIDSLAELDRGLNDTGPDPGDEPWPAEAQPPVAPARPASSEAPAPPPLEPGSRRRMPDRFPSAAPGRARPAPSAGSVRRAAPPPRVVAPPVMPEPASSARTHASPLSWSPSSGAPGPETFYGLTENPFSETPDLRFLYHSAAFERVSRELKEAVAGREGVVLVTGATGIGKTTTCRAVISEFDRRTVTSLVTRRIWNFDDLVRTVLVDFGVASSEDLADRRLGREDLTKTLKEFLSSLAPLHATAVLVIDDAHALEADVLEQVKALADAASGKRLQIVLVGHRELLTAVDQYQLRDLARLVTARLEVLPLTADEIHGYVAHRVSVAGPSARVDFDAQACEKLFEFSSGNPKLVNMLCDRALTYGFESSASVIDGTMVGDAAEHLNRGVPPSPRRGATAVIALSIAACMLAGAGAAAWVFRDDLSRTITQLRGGSAPGR